MFLLISGHLCQALVPSFDVHPVFTQQGMTTVDGPQRPVRESALSPPVRPSRSTPSAGLRPGFPVSPHTEQPSGDEEALWPLPHKSPQGHGHWATAPMPLQPRRAGSHRCPTQGCPAALIPPETRPNPKPKSVRKHQGSPHPEPLRHCWGGCHFVPMLCPGGCRSLIWGKAALGLATTVGWLVGCFPQNKVRQ